MIKQAPFKPTDIAGCSLWLDGADSSQIIFSSGSNVNTWNDKSGFSNSCSNQSLGTTITYPGTKINGLNTVNFTAGCIRGALNSTSVVNTTDVTIVIVTVETAANNNLRIFSLTTAANYQDDQANQMLIYAAPGANQVTFYRAGVQPTAYTVIQNVPFIYTVTQTSGTGSQWLNGGSNITAAITTSAFAVTNYNIGTLYLANQNYTGLMGEVIMYKTLLSTTQRQQVESYLAQKWGLHQQLPQGHPGTRGIVYPSQQIPTAIYWRYQSAFNPTSIGGCQIWLDAADSATFTLNGSTVSTWIDKTGNGFNVSQATAGSQPTRGSNEVVFNGSTSLQYSGSVGIFGNSYTSYVMHTPTNNTDYRQGVISIKDSTTGFDFEIGQFYLWTSAGSIYHQFTATVNSKTILGITSTTSLALNYSINGQPFTAGGAGWFSVTAGSLLLIGNSQYSGVGFIGTINEYLLFTRTLTATEHNQITGYLAWKWGSQSSLPANHPFKNAAPVGTTNPAGISRPANVLPIPSIACTPIRTYFLVTGGLVFHVDAGNPASYPGSGSTWFDLTTSGLNVTLYSSPTYSSANGGYIAFTPSSSQYGGTTLSYNTALTRWTTEAWHYFTNVTVGNLSAIICKTFAGDVNFALGSPVGGASGKNLAAAYYAGTWYYTSSSYTLPSVGWYHLVGTYDGTNLRLYVNNVLTQTQASSQTPGLGGGLIHLMRRWDTGDYWGGYLAIARVYNRALSADEVNTNYQVNKARFGLL